MLKEYMQRVRSGGKITPEEITKLATEVEPQSLFDAADQLRRTFHNENLDLCSIVNAKSGKCSEDCKFCAQSSWYDVSVETYESVDQETMLTMAQENESYGITRFSLVTAGREVTDNQLEVFGKMYKELGEKTGLSLCASMGLLTREKAERLKSFGVSRYHCNLETSRSYFPKVCTTHSWEEKVESIRFAQEAGMDVCSGGIIGIGENLEQRIELAFELRELGILSIPINILTPIPNTPFADCKPLSLSEILTSVALFRFINPQAVIRLAGGRDLLKENQSQCFTSGANGAIVGNYLTTSGLNIAEDKAMFKGLGFQVP